MYPSTPGMSTGTEPSSRSPMVAVQLDRGKQAEVYWHSADCGEAVRRAAVTCMMAQVVKCLYALSLLVYAAMV